MVNPASTYDFSTIVDGFLTQKKLVGPNGPSIASHLRSRMRELLSHADVRYMPAFKILDLIAAVTNIGAAVADNLQLRPGEVKILLREALSDSAPLIHQFMLDAALERARYEPLMLAPHIADARAERSLILNRRWAAMRAAHQEKHPLPDHWMDIIDQAIDHALAAPDFRAFRPGPLLQLFAEMLAMGRKLHHEGAPLPALADALAADSPLWRRYALKSKRYSEKNSAPPDLRTLQPATQRIH